MTMSHPERLTYSAMIAASGEFFCIFRWRLSLLSSAFSSGQKDNLSEDVLEEEQGYVADQGGSNRRYNPAQGNVSEDVPVQFPAAFGQADAHNGADNGLGAGNRNQGERRQIVAEQKVLKRLGGE